MAEQTQDGTVTNGRQKAAKAAVRQDRLSEVMRANLRKRRGQKKARVDEPDVSKDDENKDS